MSGWAGLWVGTGLALVAVAISDAGAMVRDGLKALTSANASAENQPSPVEAAIRKVADPSRKNWEAREDASLGYLIGRAK